jgi:hypothetical protein
MRTNKKDLLRRMFGLQGREFYSFLFIPVPEDQTFSSTTLLIRSNFCTLMCETKLYTCAKEENYIYTNIRDKFYFYKSVMRGGCKQNARHYLTSLPCLPKNF